MTSARRLPVAFFRSATHSPMLPMLAAWTPQSIRICAGPLLPGTVSRKKSPNPTRYIRTRMPLAPPTEPDETAPEPALPAGVFAAGAVALDVLAAGAAVLPRALVLVFALAFLFAFVLAFALALVFALVFALA